MRITDAVKVDHEYRHYRKAQTLLQTIHRRSDWYNRHMPGTLTPTHAARASEITRALELEVAGPKLAWEINTSLSRRPILQLPVKEIMDYIFPNLAPPQPAQLNELENSLVELMTMRGRTLAAQQHKFLLMCEIAYRAKQNWYMIFNTLTVAPGEYYAVFDKRSKSFKNYIRKYERLATDTTNQSLRSQKHNHNNIHFACVEEGAKHGRLHIHCLHLSQIPPKGAYDPNHAKLRPTERELDCIRNLWPHGRSAPIIVRYSPKDAWGQKGYRWPIDHNTNAPMQIKSPLALANYLSKYITKGYNSCQRAKLLWRVKKSHKLGTKLLDELAEQLSTSTLLILTHADNLKSKLNNTTIPQNLLRQASLRTLRNRLSTTSHNGFTNLTEIAKHCTPRLSPLHYSRASTKTIQENNQQNTLFLSILNLSNEASSRDAWHDLQKATKAINDKYFPANSGVYGTTSTRDHIYNT